MDLPTVFCWLWVCKRSFGSDICFHFMMVQANDRTSLPGIELSFQTFFFFYLKKKCKFKKPQIARTCRWTITNPVCTRSIPMSCGTDWVRVPDYSKSTDPDFVLCQLLVFWRWVVQDNSQGGLCGWHVQLKTANRKRTPGKLGDEIFTQCQAQRSQVNQSRRHKVCQQKQKQYRCLKKKNLGTRSSVLKCLVGE